jgi:hypothetical protein
LSDELLEERLVELEDDDCDEELLELVTDCAVELEELLDELEEPLLLDDLELDDDDELELETGSDAGQ